MYCCYDYFFLSFIFIFFINILIILSELIKEHRRNQLYKEFNLIPLPVNNDRISESFKGDIMAR